MAERLILLDSSILIDFYRKSNKENSVWFQLLKDGHTFAISAVTKYEINAGATKSQLTYWNEIFNLVQVIPFDESCVDTAVDINESLKQKRKQIALADLFIAAKAVANNLPCATLNKKHFVRIDGLELI